MAHELYEAVFEVSPHKGNLFFVETVLANWADAEGKLYASYTHLAKRLRMDRSYVVALVKSLLKAKTIVKVEAEEQGVNCFQFTAPYLDVAAEFRALWRSRKAKQLPDEMPGEVDSEQGSEQGGEQGSELGSELGSEQGSELPGEQGGELGGELPGEKNAPSKDKHVNLKPKTHSCAREDVKDIYHSPRGRVVTALTTVGERFCTANVNVARDYVLAIDAISPEFDNAPEDDITRLVEDFRKWWFDEREFKYKPSLQGFAKWFPDFREWRKTKAQSVERRFR